MIPSNDKIANLAMRIAAEVYTGGCIDCGSSGVEFHEILKRQMRHTLGAVPCLLGVTLAPLCKKHHIIWTNNTTEEQIELLQRAAINSYELIKAQRDQLIALKARVATCK